MANISNATDNWFAWTIKSEDYSHSLEIELTTSLAANTTGPTPKSGETIQSPYTAEELIILIGTPIIFILGVTGNILSAIVMKRQHFRSISTGAYLFCLAIVDSIFLSVNSMTKNFIRILTGVDLTKLSYWSCKMYVFLLMTSKCLSAWLIVAVTVERLIIVCLPHRAKVLATRKRAWVVISIVTLLSCSMFILVLCTYGLVERPWGWDCTMLLHYKAQGLRVVLNTIDLVVYSLFPAVILFISNIVLIYKVMRSHSFRKESIQKGAASEKDSEKSNDDVRRLTVMLILVSAMFLVCTSPTSIIFLIKSVDDNIDEIHFALYRSTYLLQLSNSAINFLLYCVSGPAFRRELGTLCKCLHKEKHPNSGGSKSYVSPPRGRQLSSSQSGESNPTTDSTVTNDTRL